MTTTTDVPDLPALMRATREDVALCVTEGNRSALDVEDMLIDSPAMYQIATQYLSRIKSNWNKAEARRKALTGPLNSVVAMINDDFRAPMTMLADAEKRLKDMLISYDTAQHALAEAQQKEADERIEAERQKVLADANAKAIEMMRCGNDQAAADITAQAQLTTAIMTSPTVMAEIPKIAGTSTSRPWKGRVTDFTALYKCIAQRVDNEPHLEAMLTFRQQEVNNYCRALKRNVDLDGIEAYQDITISQRAR